ncbi:MAG TPA: hypothetical protein VJ837_00145 [Candidatus Paceibacterota bacterium]|nr:hypothetical protein [Candidatus Paceibacterota bacterium]
MHKGFDIATGRLRPRHLLILVTPAIATAVIMALWAWSRSLGLFVSQSDAGITTNSYLPILGMIYGFTAVIILNRVIEEDVRLHQCVESDDIEAVKAELKKRIHPLVHILMALMTILLIIGFSVLPYDSFWSGIKDVGGLTFCLLLYWKVALVLDNPLRAPWVRDVIPKEMRAELELESKE